MWRVLHVCMHHQTRWRHSACWRLGCIKHAQSHCYYTSHCCVEILRCHLDPVPKNISQEDCLCLNNCILLRALDLLPSDMVFQMQIGHVHWCTTLHWGRLSGAAPKPSFMIGRSGLTCGGSITAMVGRAPLVKCIRSSYSSKNGSLIILHFLFFFAVLLCREEKTN